MKETSIPASCSHNHLSYLLARSSPSPANITPYPNLPISAMRSSNSWGWHNRLTYIINRTERTSVVACSYRRHLDVYRVNGFSFLPTFSRTNDLSDSIRVVMELVAIYVEFILHQISLVISKVWVDSHCMHRWPTINWRSSATCISWTSKWMTLFANVYKYHRAQDSPCIMPGWP